MPTRRHLHKTALILTAAALLPANAQKPQPQAAKKTLVIVSHPYPEHSVLTKGLQQAAESVGNITVRNLETLYGHDTRAIDGEEERRRPARLPAGTDRAAATIAGG